MLKPLLHRHQPPLARRAILLSGLGGALGIAVLAALTTAGPWVVLMAPFGASCVLLFTLPASPLSQPANVIGGHVLAAGIGLAAMAVSPALPAAALAVGVAIAAMAALRLTHPPAGANPLVVLALHPGVGFLICPVALGAVLLVAVAMLVHRASGTPYPLPLPLPLPSPELA